MQTVSKELKTRLLTIHPSEAKQIWEDHLKRVSDGRCNQRPLSSGTAEKYAADMRSGAWAVTHQGIAFDEDGNLIDGQQRIFAITLAGVPVKMMVTTGIPPKCGRIATIDAIDGGRPRGHGQKLHMHGVANANRAAAAITGIAVGLCGSVGLKRLSYTQVADIYYIYTREITEILQMTSIRTRVAVGYVNGPLAFASAAPESRDLAIQATTMLSTKEGWTARHPVAAFDRSFEEGALHNARGVYDKYTTGFDLVASMLFAMKNGQTMQILRPSGPAREWLLHAQQANVKKVTTIVRGYK